MPENVGHVVREVCERFGCDQTRMMDIVRETQRKLGHVPDEAIDAIAHWTGSPRVNVAHVVTFYSFYSDTPQGSVVIRLCDDVIDRLFGYEEVREAFEHALGIKMGETTPDGAITLTRTACIGLSDQAPAALVNDVPVTKLTPDAAERIVRELREHGDPKKLVHHCGDGNNAHPLVHSMVENNLQHPGPIVFSTINRGEAINKALAMSPAEVIRTVKTSRLRGRGGAGFPVGLKWEFARAADGDRKLVFCNADEGEPGTFKDRVILTECPDRVFAGMTIAAYAVGAAEGIVYLRGEYEYLLPFLENVLEKRRADGLLGKQIKGRHPFDFDIRIQLGAGAYICGEETALLSSCEGKAGEPMTRPPFPVQKGYLGNPSVVNNVESFACVTKILEEGPATFSEHGTPASSGTKLLSIAGDCMRPGVYEIPMGVTMRAVLELCGGEGAGAVQVGGPSRTMICPEQFDRIICFDDLATGGAIMVLDSERNIPEIARVFMEFFIEESCGYCAPCRIGNVLLKNKLDIIIAGRGEPSDLDELEELGKAVIATSRCGLGQASPNPILSTLRSFRPAYEALVKPDPDGFKRSFDLKEAVGDAERIAGRASVHANGGES